MSNQSPPDPLVITPFNSSYYAASSTNYVTLNFTNATYYKKSGGIISGNVTIQGTLAMGTNNITGTGTIGGTLTTAAQPNITSLGVLTGLLINTTNGSYGSVHTNGATAFGTYIQDNTNCWFGTQVANASNMGLFVAGNLSKSLIIN